MKHTRKLISLLLVLALALAISPSAFAAGDIVASLTNGTLNFSTIKAQLRGKVGNASYVTGLSVSPAQGTLYQGYVSEAYRGSGVATTQVFYFNSTGYDAIENITFVPNPNYTGEAEISFNVVGDGNFAGTITVTVEQQEASFSYSSNGEPIRFQAEDFSAWCLSVTGRSIRGVSFALPAERYGTLYYNYVDENIFDGLVDPGTQYLRAGLPAIDNITLIPTKGFDGTFYISFAGVDLAGETVRGRLRISISGGASSSGSDLSYTVTAGQRLAFRASDFSNVCYNETTFELKYIRFTSLPDSTYGKLYHNNTAVSSTATAYYYSSGANLIENLSFVAGSWYDGIVTIPFTGYSTENTTFHGVITIEISDSELVNFPYTVRAGQRVYIGSAGVADISEVCYVETGYQLSYVRFTALPDSSQGALYYNNTRITSVSSTSTTNNYYAYGSGNDRLLENVNFLADDNFEGTFAIPFTAYSSRGTSFNGALRMEVTDAGSSAIRYVVRAGQRINLRADDFADACSRRTGYPLNYVRFTSLPSSTYGVFYENTTTTINAYTNFYRSGNTHLLENISFVANANYFGTFTVNYTCYPTSGSSFTGTFTVVVGTASMSQAPTITYYSTGPAAKFNASDFSSAASQSLSDSLAGVRFTAPAASAGKMYYVYVSPASNIAFVSGQSYSTALLSQLAFLPRAGFSGTVSIPYTATDNSGNTASGTVVVSVTPPVSSSYFTDMGSYSWAVPAVDFLRYYQVVTGVATTEYSPAESMKRGDFVLMLSRAYGFSSTGTVSFPDVPQDRYYASAISMARSRGIVEGDSSGLFHPEDPISRQDAAVMLYRCMRLRGQSLTAPESALLGFYDRGSIVSYAVEAMAALVNFGVIQGDGTGYLRPADSMTRAEMAAVLYRAVTY